MRVLLTILTSIVLTAVAGTHQAAAQAPPATAPAGNCDVVLHDGATTIAMTRAKPGAALSRLPRSLDITATNAAATVSIDGAAAVAVNAIPSDLGGAPVHTLDVVVAAGAQACQQRYVVVGAPGWDPSPVIDFKDDEVHAAFAGIVSGLTFTVKRDSTVAASVILGPKSGVHGVYEATGSAGKDLTGAFRLRSGDTDVLNREFGLALNNCVQFPGLKTTQAALTPTAASWAGPSLSVTSASIDCTLRPELSVSLLFNPFRGSPTQIKGDAKLSSDEATINAQLVTNAGPVALTSIPLAGGVSLESPVVALRATGFAISGDLKFAGVGSANARLVTDSGNVKIDGTSSLSVASFQLDVSGFGCSTDALTGKATCKARGTLGLPSLPGITASALAFDYDSTSDAFSISSGDGKLTLGAYAFAFDKNSLQLKLKGTTHSLLAGGTLSGPDLGDLRLDRFGFSDESGKMALTGKITGRTVVPFGSVATLTVQSGQFATGDRGNELQLNSDFALDLAKLNLPALTTLKLNAHNVLAKIAFTGGVSFSGGTYDPPQGTLFSRTVAGFCDNSNTFIARHDDLYEFCMSTHLMPSRLAGTDDLVHIAVKLRDTDGKPKFSSASITTPGETKIHVRMGAQSLELTNVALTYNGEPAADAKPPVWFENADCRPNFTGSMNVMATGIANSSQPISFIPYVSIGTHCIFAEATGMMSIPMGTNLTAIVTEVVFGHAPRLRSDGSAQAVDATTHEPTLWVTHVDATARLVTPNATLQFDHVGFTYDDARETKKFQTIGHLNLGKTAGYTVGQNLTTIFTFLGSVALALVRR